MDTKHQKAGRLLLLVGSAIALMFAVGLAMVSPVFTDGQYVLLDQEAGWTETKLPFDLSDPEAKEILVEATMHLFVMHPVFYHAWYDDCIDELFVNGLPVPATPFCNYEDGTKLNLQPFLRSGENTIAAKIRNTGGGAMFSLPPNPFDPLLLTVVLVFAILFPSLLFALYTKHAVPFSRRNLLVLGATTAAMGLAFLLVWNQRYFGDEGYHINQIQLFLSGELKMADALTTIPGYHVVLAAMAYVTKATSISWLRLFSFLLSLVSVYVFYRAASATDKKAAAPLTVQYVFLPIIFPFFFLLYTDIPALLLLIGAFLCFQRKWYLAVALLAGGSLLIRQNNIIYLAMFYCMFLLEEAGVLLSYEGRLKSGCRLVVEWSSSAVRILASKESLAFLLGLAGFVWFVLWNDGVAIGDKTAHPFPAFYLGNFYFLLFLYFWLLLPLHIAKTKSVLVLLRKYPWVITLVMLFIAFGMLTFTNSHGYNQGANSSYLRNRILVYMVEDPLHKFYFMLCAAVSLLSLSVTRLKKPSYYLLYPATFTFLSFAWLIEQRYYFMFFVLLFLMRQREHLRTEWVTALYIVLVNAYLFYHIVERSYFI